MANKNKHRSVSSDVSAQGETALRTPKAGTRSFSTEFKPDYTYIKQDLKRIAILAVAFIVILVAFSFFLR
jgi:hypothetical protein